MITPPISLLNLSNISLASVPKANTIILFVISNSQLKVAGNDALFLIIAGSISRQLEDLGGEVLKYRGEINCA